MDHARRAVLSHGLRRVSDWPVWSLPGMLRAFVLVVVCAYVAWIGVGAAAFRFGTPDFLLFAALLACDVATVELTRRSSEPASGVITGCSEQKLRWNVTSGLSVSAVPGTTNES